ncbi:putative uncharacterized protein DDB_G0289263 isoform X1 [Diachasma alloeum]|uniref:putative uncharacterized protein DDB_G0289263 isoform X1 n=2 Tax=Diachasma alloeum TaxID=454923 RepID=UPI0007384841|nr:putative uncharacterized protein DDB_G0289263 isoform X1 [Diachasma alloeum]
MWFHQEMNSKFYVDSDYESLSFNNSKMETEVRTLKQELSRTRDALKSATKRCRELVRELDSLTVCHESERNLRDQQLSKILRALLVLESRLRQEQKSIRQQLCEKDNVIKNQQLEIAKLRRYTKNYIKSKREQGLCKSPSTPETIETPGDQEADITRFDNGLGNDIQRLKREIITKFSGGDDEMRSCVRKTDSFAGSDVSKESLTSSENTDGSIVTTTTDGSPSLISTEGFCEGESSDISPGSTLNKSTRQIRNNSDSDSEGRTVLENLGDDNAIGRRRVGVVRKDPLVIFDNQVTKMTRSDSKDDGMDCNFVSGDEEEGEPIYVNSYNNNNQRNLRENETEFLDDSHNNNNNNNNTNNNGLSKIDSGEKLPEETSGNWYSDPDEDRIADDIIRHNTYRPNSNHNSVLECVNQILLRDMEDEETILSVSRKFKHRGRIVSFQPARLSDIESVGSEMERRNSEEGTPEKDLEACSEDEYGMKIPHSSHLIPSGSATESSPEDELDENSSTRAIPIVIIEPNLSTTPRNPSASPELSLKSRSSPSPILRLERIEEKTCLSMSSKGLTIAKNLDYEDIESLPEVISPPPKTPPALPPKPQFKNNTLILKKIPSPSFLIDETRKKHPQGSETPAYVKRIFGITGTPTKPPIPTARSLNFKETPRKSNVDNGNVKPGGKAVNNDESDPPRVTNIVKHFEEFKIGESDKTKETAKGKPVELEEMDIRQNFEEFNLDECDLSDDPDRPEGDGSERLTNGVFSRQESVKDNNNGDSGNSNGIYDHFLEATGLSTKSILTPSRLLSNHKSMLKPKDVKYKSKIKATGGMEKSGNQTQVRHWTGPFV